MSKEFEPKPNESVVMWVNSGYKNTDYGVAIGKIIKYVSTIEVHGISTKTWSTEITNDVYNFSGPSVKYNTYSMTQLSMERAVNNKTNLIQMLLSRT